MTLPKRTFHQVYIKHIDDILRFAYWLSGNQEDAKDLTSEAFVRLWTTPTVIDVQTVKMYLITIVRNLYLQKKQKDKSNSSLEFEYHDPKETIDKIVENKSELTQVMQHLQSLPEIDRTALLLYANEEYSYQEIADYLKLSLSNVKIKISRTRKILQDLKNGETI